MKKNIFPYAITVFLFLLSIIIIGKVAQNIHDYGIEGRTGEIVTWIGVRWYVEIFLLSALAGITYQIPLLINVRKSLLKTPDALNSTLNQEKRISLLKAMLMMVVGLAYPAALSYELYYDMVNYGRFTHYVLWEMVSDGMFALIMVCGFVFGMEVIQALAIHGGLNQRKASELTDQETI